MIFRAVSALAGMVAASVILGIPSAEIFAHEGRDVGDYNLVVGFREEPAYEGLLNAVSVVVTRIDHADEAASEIVEDVVHASHDEDTSQDSHSSELDVHGALFISPALKRDETFEFEFPQHVGEANVKYHVHPGDHQGVISVSESSLAPFENTIMIGDEGLTPEVVEIRPGDSLTWVNHTRFNAVLMSGPLSAMGDGGEIAPSEGSADLEPTASQNPYMGAHLDVEITHLPSGAAQTLSLSPAQDQRGHYIAEFIPTAPGDYSFRIFGEINGTSVNELFESGPNTFDTVVASDELQFPNVLASSREVENAARSALDAAREADTAAGRATDAANRALLAAMLGISIGVLGVGVGIFGLIVARRSK